MSILRENFSDQYYNNAQGIKPNGKGMQSFLISFYCFWHLLVLFTHKLLRKSPSSAENFPNNIS